MISTHIGYMGVPVYKCVVTLDDSNQVYRMTRDISVSVSLLYKLFCTEDSKHSLRNIVYGL